MKNMSVALIYYINDCIGVYVFNDREGVHMLTSTSVTKGLGLNLYVWLIGVFIGTHTFSVPTSSC